MNTAPDENGMQEAWVGLAIRSFRACAGVAGANVPAPTDVGLRDAPHRLPPPPYANPFNNAAMRSRIWPMSLSVAIKGGAVTIVSVARRM